MQKSRSDGKVDRARHGARVVRHFGYEGRVCFQNGIDALGGTAAVFGDGDGAFGAAHEFTAERFLQARNEAAHGGRLGVKFGGRGGEGSRFLDGTKGFPGFQIKSLIHESLSEIGKTSEL